MFIKKCPSRFVSAVNGLLLAFATACSGGEFTIDETELAGSSETFAEPAPGLSEEGSGDAIADSMTGADLGKTEQALSFSYLATCSNISRIATPFTANIKARCRRRNGTIVDAAFTGFCTSDIANCDGILRCGRC